ncbi:MAG: hypothetical protein ABH840_02825 [Nanoarchaeota archaeon]
MKKWVIGLIVLLVVLVIFFFPKSCGGGGGTGGHWSSTECDCVGFKLVSPWNLGVMDAVFEDCYGICLKSSCKNYILWADKKYEKNKTSEMEISVRGKDMRIIVSKIVEVSLPIISEEQAVDLWKKVLPESKDSEYVYNYSYSYNVSKEGMYWKVSRDYSCTASYICLGSESGLIDSYSGNIHDYSGVAVA